MKLPDRWLNYSPIGNIVPGTNIICFKVPLKFEYFRNHRTERLTVEDVARSIPRLGLVINLTNTPKYYSMRDWTRCGIENKWIKTEGHIIPRESLLIEFCKTIYEYNLRNPHKVIGVHCTHGLNRTGYFVCSYMTLCKQMSPSEAIQNFEISRGHHIERKNYLDKIHHHATNDELKEILRKYQRISQQKDEERSNRYNWVNKHAK